MISPRKSSELRSKAEEIKESGLKSTNSYDGEGSQIYTHLQRVTNQNNEYLPQIPNWENHKTFLLPKEFVMRNFSKLQDHIDKEFTDRGMRNILCESQFEYAKVHKCRRFSHCLCKVFTRDLLQLAYHQKIENVHRYLERYSFCNFYILDISSNPKYICHLMSFYSGCS